MREVCQWQLLVSPGYQEQFSYLCIILDNSNEDLNAVSSMLLTGCVRSGCEGDRLTHALLGLTRHTHSSLGKSDWMNTLNIQIPCVRTKKAVGMLQRAEFAFRMEIIFPPRVRCTQYAKKIKIFIFANDPMHILLFWNPLHEVLFHLNDWPSTQMRNKNARNNTKSILVISLEACIESTNPDSWNLHLLIKVQRKMKALLLGPLCRLKLWLLLSKRTPLQMER